MKTLAAHQLWDEKANDPLVSGNYRLLIAAIEAWRRDLPSAVRRMERYFTPSHPFSYLRPDDYMDVIWPFKGSIMLDLLVSCTEYSEEEIGRGLLLTLSPEIREKREHWLTLLKENEKVLSAEIRYALDQAVRCGS